MDSAFGTSHKCVKLTFAAKPESLNLVTLESDVEREPLPPPIFVLTKSSMKGSKMVEKFTRSSGNKPGVILPLAGNKTHLRRDGRDNDNTHLWEDEGDNEDLGSEEKARSFFDRRNAGREHPKTLLREFEEKRRKNNGRPSKNMDQRPNNSQSIQEKPKPIPSKEAMENPMLDMSIKNIGKMLFIGPCSIGVPNSITSKPMSRPKIGETSGTAAKTLPEAKLSLVAWTKVLGGDRRRSICGFT
ncbi:hypothetical protein EUTSA_v10024034mg [Eutrema salsugineum]|uniref:Uncharacterized protein n=1 Tax=Eutrema salsugineum TaxID=72664 RepID=V4KHI7_EUTSA|nr:hypothetical protein EUTSA_v10024034mg [Eutrema salsugineum]